MLILLCSAFAFHSTRRTFCFVPIQQNQISNLTNLETLHINWTHITGEIPNSIGNLTSIEIIHFNDNQLSGLIPDSICNLNLNFRFVIDSKEYI